MVEGVAGFSLGGASGATRNKTYFHSFDHGGLISLLSEKGSPWYRMINHKVGI